MCGIAGSLEPKAGRTAEVLDRIARSMAATLTHRGPDSDGSWTDATAGIALGFRRLAIVDLSPAGDQPMTSQDGRYVLVYNGEIYNHRDLRSELERNGVGDWRGHSDTEVMLAGFSHWGIEPTLDRLNGMFALALWDRKTRTLTLARDRMGEKPLYFGWCGGTFLFGSELKALAAHPDWRDVIDRRALSELLTYDYIPAPRSIFEGIRKLRPGCFVSVPSDPQTAGSRISERRYWSAADVFGEAQRQSFVGSAEDAVHRLDGLLRDSVSMRLEADVPVGVFLSGGIDSSLIASVARQVAAQPVRTFTIGFDDPAFDEAPHAAAIAKRLGTEHTELYATEADALATVRELPYFFDEPFGDISQIPTALLARLTRAHVTVGLSGDGGDELFCGYPRYRRLSRDWARISRTPAAWRQRRRRIAERLPSDAIDRAFGWPTALVGARRRYGTPGRKLRDALLVRGAKDAASLYMHRLKRWRGETALVDDDGALDGSVELDTLPNAQTAADLAMYIDARRYLPDDILVKVDRATMASSLESRAPLLDHRIVEFAWSLPLAFKLGDRHAKLLLRQTLARYVPEHLFDRPKSGFDPPLAQWLRGGLRDWAEELLEPSRLVREGIFRSAPITRKWREHIRGGRNWRHELWTVLAFQAWHEQWRAKATPADQSTSRRAPVG